MPSCVMGISEWIEKTSAIGIVVKECPSGTTFETQPNSHSTNASA